MRKNIIPFVLLLVASLISCNTSTQLSNEELDRISWSAFCKDFGYNEKADANNEKAIKIISTLGADPLQKKRRSTSWA